MSHGEGLASNPPPISIIFIHVSHFLLLFLGLTMWLPYHIIAVMSIPAGYIALSLPKVE